eukprot:TRINITY_DN2471_c0_g1_i2.p1 TRINITY_DN2471_c0_g1~~TRINITY_DN2471_c0_g1_i2.p1  ORF type:complete len:412 (-),score=65.20 TRINITY_DN2471_c0_g1_i2:1827-3062(-)
MAKKPCFLVLVVLVLTAVVHGCEPFHEQCGEICCERGAECLSAQCIGSTQIIPTLGANTGGTITTIVGAVPDLPNLECLFGAGSPLAKAYPATRLSASSAMCVSPAVPGGNGYANVKLQVKDQPALNATVQFYYYPPLTLANLTTALAPITGLETVVRLEPLHMPPTVLADGLCFCYIDFTMDTLSVPCFQIDPQWAACKFPAVKAYLTESASVPVKLTLNGGQDNSTTQLFFFYQNPVVTRTVPRTFPFERSPQLTLFGSGFFFTGDAKLLVGSLAVPLTIVNDSTAIAIAPAIHSTTSPRIDLRIEMDGVHPYLAFQLPLDIACGQISSCGDCLTFNCSWCAVGGCQGMPQCADGSHAWHTCDVPPGAGHVPLWVWVLIGVTCGGAAVIAAVVIGCVCWRRREGYKTVV